MREPGSELEWQWNVSLKSRTLRAQRRWKAIKQAIVGGCVGIVTPCFGTRRHKRSTHDSGRKAFQSNAIGQFIQQQTTVRCRSHFSGISTG